jgi:hypothetical protein
MDHFKQSWEKPGKFEKTEWETGFYREKWEKREKLPFLKKHV